MKYKIDEMPEGIKPYKVLNWEKIKNIKSQPFVEYKINYDKILNLGWRMAQTCVSDKGIGLAGAQVGVFKKAILIQDYDVENSKFLPSYTLMLNPNFEPLSKEKSADTEYCLSVPGKGYKIERYDNILVTYYNARPDATLLKQQVEKSGLEARILQHEYDHTNGVSIPQRWKYQNK